MTNGVSENCNISETRNAIVESSNRQTRKHSIYTDTKDTDKSISRFPAKKSWLLHLGIFLLQAFPFITVHDQALDLIQAALKGLRLNSQGIHKRVVQFLLEIMDLLVNITFQSIFLGLADHKTWKTMMLGRLVEAFRGPFCIVTAFSNYFWLSLVIGPFLVCLRPTTRANLKSPKFTSILP